MSLWFLDAGRLVSLTDFVELLDRHIDKRFDVAEVLGQLVREGLVLHKDRLRYSREAADGLIYEQLEVWGHVGSTQKERQLILTLRAKHSAADVLVQGGHSEASLDKPASPRPSKKGREFISRPVPSEKGRET